MPEPGPPGLPRIRKPMSRSASRKALRSGARRAPAGRLSLNTGAAPLSDDDPDDDNTIPLPPVPGYISQDAVVDGLQQALHAQARFPTLTAWNVDELLNRIWLEDVERRANDPDATADEDTPPRPVLAPHLYSVVNEAFVLRSEFGSVAEHLRPGSGRHKDGGAERWDALLRQAREDDPVAALRALLPPDPTVGLAGQLHYTARVGNELLLNSRALAIRGADLAAECERANNERLELDTRLTALTKTHAKTAEELKATEAARWDLQVAAQERERELTDAIRQNNRLQRERDTLESDLATVHETVETLRAAEERLTAALATNRSRHEAEVASVRRSQITLQREKAEMSKRCNALKAELDGRIQRAGGRRHNQPGSPTPDGIDGEGAAANQGDEEAADRSLMPPPGLGDESDVADPVTPARRGHFVPTSVPSAGPQLMHVQTLTGSLSNAHRRIEKLRSQLNRERQGNADLQRLVQEHQQTIEDMEREMALFADPAHESSAAAVDGIPRTALAWRDAEDDENVMAPRRVSHSGFVPRHARPSRTTAPGSPAAATPEPLTDGSAAEDSAPEVYRSARSRSNTDTSTSSASSSPTRSVRRPRPPASRRRTGLRAARSSRRTSGHPRRISPAATAGPAPQALSDILATVDRPPPFRLDFSRADPSEGSPLTLYPPVDRPVLPPESPLAARGMACPRCRSPPVATDQAVQTETEAVMEAHPVPVIVPDPPVAASEKREDKGIQCDPPAGVDAHHGPEPIVLRSVETSTVPVLSDSKGTQRGAPDAVDAGHGPEPVQFHHAATNTVPVRQHCKETQSEVATAVDANHGPDALIVCHAETNTVPTPVDDKTSQSELPTTADASHGPEGLLMRDAETSTTASASTSHKGTQSDLLAAVDGTYGLVTVVGGDIEARTVATPVTACTQQDQVPILATSQQDHEFSGRSHAATRTDGLSQTEDGGPVAVSTSPGPVHGPSAAEYNGQRTGTDGGAAPHARKGTRVAALISALNQTSHAAVETGRASPGADHPPTPLARSPETARTVHGLGSPRRPSEAEIGLDPHPPTATAQPSIQEPALVTPPTGDASSGIAVDTLAMAARPSARTPEPPAPQSPAVLNGRSVAHPSLSDPSPSPTHLEPTADFTPAERVGGAVPTVVNGIMTNLAGIAAGAVPAVLVSQGPTNGLAGTATDPTAVPSSPTVAADHGPELKLVQEAATVVPPNQTVEACTQRDAPVTQEAGWGTEPPTVHHAATATEPLAIHEVATATESPDVTEASTQAASPATVEASCGPAPLVRSDRGTQRGAPVTVDAGFGTDPVVRESRATQADPPRLVDASHGPESAELAAPVGPVTAPLRGPPPSSPLPPLPAFASPAPRRKLSLAHTTALDMPFVPDEIEVDETPAPPVRVASPGGDSPTFGRTPPPPLVPTGCHYCRSSSASAAPDAGYFPTVTVRRQPSVSPTLGGPRDERAAPQRPSRPATPPPPALLARALSQDWAGRPPPLPTLPRTLRAYGSVNNIDALVTFSTADEPPTPPPPSLGQVLAASPAPSGQTSPHVVAPVPSRLVAASANRGTLSPRGQVVPFDASPSPPTPRDPVLTANPLIIHAVAQTMVGEFMWKSTRASGVGRERRHLRFFWIHPYSKTIHWSTKAPGADRSHPLAKSKSAYLRAVRLQADYQVTHEHDLSPYTFIVTTPDRTLKFKAVNRVRHEIWCQALSFLQTRGVLTPAPLARPSPHFPAPRHRSQITHRPHADTTMRVDLDVPAERPTLATAATTTDAESSGGSSAREPNRSVFKKASYGYLLGKLAPRTGSSPRSSPGGTPPSRPARPASMHDNDDDSHDRGPVKGWRALLSPTTGPASLGARRHSSQTLDATKPRIIVHPPGRRAVPDEWTATEPLNEVPDKDSTQPQPRDSGIIP